MPDTPKNNSLAARLAGIELAIAQLARLTATANKSSPSTVAQAYRALAKSLPADAPGRAEMAAVLLRIARTVQPRKRAARARKDVH